MKAIIVFITSANRQEAEKIARLLVEEKLAACVQILPEIISFYRWREEIIQDREVLLLCKTTEENFGELEKTVRVNHSYEIPEIVAIPASLGSEPYLNWLAENTAK
jgi:periplasmic divalent cation tolerance protein